MDDMVSAYDGGGFGQSVSTAQLCNRNMRLWPLPDPHIDEVPTGLFTIPVAAALAAELHLQFREREIVRLWQICAVDGPTPTALDAADFDALTGFAQ